MGAMAAVVPSTSSNPPAEGLNAAFAAICTALVLAAGAQPAIAAQRCQLEYWVAVDGSDAATGDKTHPFRSVARARDAVRSDDRRTQCDTYVTLRGGTHRLSQPLQLDHRDSGTSNRDITYRAARGERPVIAGSVPVTGWSLHDAKLGIYRAQVVAKPTRQLYINGQRMTRAQTEKYPSDFERTDTGYRFIAPGRTMPVWTNPRDIEAVTLSQWKMMRCPVESIVGPDIRMRELCWHNANVFQTAPVPPKPPEIKPTTPPSLWNFRLLYRLENAYEFLDQPGEWYLDAAMGWLYVIPPAGVDITKAAVEMPVLEVLVDAQGTLDEPIRNLRFEGLTFAFATWMGPSTDNGYAVDQSGFHLTTYKHAVNYIGHDPDTTRTPGNVRFKYARNIVLRDNDFRNLGGVALDFDTGSQFNGIVNNRFEDIASAGIQLGGNTEADHHPGYPAQVTRDNLITNNLVRRTGREYFDTAGIYIGMTTRTTVSHNDISDVPWSGIAIGWGWGLLDEGSFPGLPGATQGMWGQYTTPSTSRGNKIIHNRIRNFLGELWDGGAIYTQGAQGTSMLDGELIAWNVASGKRPAAGGNTFYTDGGSRYVTLVENVSYDNVQGVTDFGPCGLPAALPGCALGETSPVAAADRCSSLSLCWLVFPYGGDSGGCVPHGDLLFAANYWFYEKFATVCPTNLTVNVQYVDNHFILGVFEVPTRILKMAGRQGRFRP
jgi:hypothetical protein